MQRRLRKLATASFEHPGDRPRRIGQVDALAPRLDRSAKVVPERRMVLLDLRERAPDALADGRTRLFAVAIGSEPRTKATRLVAS